MKNPIKLVCAAIAATFALASAQATTYTLQNYGTQESPVEWSTATNWDPEGVPGAGDSITWENSGDWNPYPFLAINTNITIAEFSAKYKLVGFLRSSSTSQELPKVTLTITDALGTSDYQHYYVFDGVKLVVASSATLTGSTWGNPITANLRSGSEMDVYGAITSRHITWNVSDGAILEFAPSSYQNFTSSSVTSDAGDVFNVTGGNVYFPNGMSVTGAILPMPMQ